jgi:hypothetical protein
MEIIFYDVKTRQKVGVPQDQVKKIKYTKTNKDGSIQVRHALKATYKGTTVTKFVSQTDYNALDVPEEK